MVTASTESYGNMSRPDLRKAQQRLLDKEDALKVELQMAEAKWDALSKQLWSIEHELLDIEDALADQEEDR